MAKNKLSIYLSYLLRHNPAKLGLNMDKGGWVSVDELTDAVNAEGNHTLTRELLDELVRCDDKSRYAYNGDKSKIKACQGHSIPWVEPELERKEPPKYLYHGTTEKAYSEILASGEISRMKRHAVHMQAELAKAWQSAERWHTVPTVLVIDAERMSRDGYDFGISDNGVWCTEAVPIKYITEVLRRENEKMELYANLHSHSTHSDGVYSPRELAEIAKAEGYSAIAVTDHDTATAYPELCEACAEIGMDCIFGVEFSVKEPKDYHIVAFNFDPEYPPMKKYLADMGERQTDNTRCCFEEAVSKGDIRGITWEEVLDYNKNIIWLCNDHVWRAMLAKGLVKEQDYNDWFDKNFAKQRAKYPPKKSFLHLEELVALIKDAGGFAVVAHPHGQLDDIDYLISAGVEGLEVWHSTLTPEERTRALKIGLEKGLFISGGSDHEGLLGGMYSSFPNEEELKKSCFYIPEHSVGTTREFYEEIKAHKIMR